MTSSLNNLLVVRKSNTLITARYKLSIAEQRLVLLLASEISPNDEDFKHYQIKVTDFVKMFGLENCKSMYKEVQKAAKELVSKRLDISKDGEEIYTTWLSYVRYVDGSGVVNLEFHRSLKPYFLQLKNHYTQYNTSYVIDFKIQYSMRIYELLKMDAFKAKNGQFEKYFEVSELRLLVGVNKKDYSLFSGLRQFVIEPAIKEISAKTDLTIADILYGKTGRKITSITFIVKIRPVTPTQAIEEKSDNHPVIDALIALGFSPEVAKAAKTKHGIKRLERNIAYTIMKEKAGIAKEVPAYLKSAITEDWGAAWEVEQAKKATAKKQKTSDLENEKAVTEKSALDKKSLFQKAFDDFLLLPEHQQNELKQAFLEQSDSTISAKIKAAQTKGIDIFTSPLVTSPFKVFLIQRGF